jgi:hypothetical protein
MVGRDILIGLAAGASFALVVFMGFQIARWIGDPQVEPLTPWLDPFGGSHRSLGRFLFNFPDSATGALLLAFLWFLLRAASKSVLRVEWPATLLMIVLIALSIQTSIDASAWIRWGTAIPCAVILTVLLIRFGLLPMVVALTYGTLLNNQPVPASPTAWWATGTWLVYVLLLVLAGYAFFVALGSQRLVRGDLLSD